MIAWISTQIDRFRGRGAYAATVPPMNGALRPNTLLEEAPVLSHLPAPDNLVQFRGQVLLSSGETILALNPDTGGTTEWRRCGTEVTALAVQDDTLAIGLADGNLILTGATERSLKAPAPCITALAPGVTGQVILCIGSSRNPAGEWKRDLLQRNAMGSVWSVNLFDGTFSKQADALAWPAGAALQGDQLVVVEAWAHRISRPGSAPLITDLPGYPSRLAPAPGGWWLTVFAPRNQLIELVLREAIYRDRMMAEIEPAHWIAPTLSPAADFNEPMQGGGIRTHGIIKPWAPTRSYGLLVRLDDQFRPVASYHSRADGRFHGVTSALALGNGVLIASRGGNAVLSMTEVQP